MGVPFCCPHIYHGVYECRDGQGGGMSVFKVVGGLGHEAEYAIMK